LIFWRILAVFFTLLASSVSASQFCEQILKEDFRETSNIKLIHQDGGIVFHPNKPVIDKIRFGSAASKLNLQPGDKIISINNSPLPIEDNEEYRELINLLKNPGNEMIKLEVERPDGTNEIFKLSKKSYFGHPIVETDIILNDIEITHQSSKTRLDLDVHLKWDNKKIIHRLEKILNIPKDEIINCQFRKSQELDNILKKIWYPSFDTTLTGASIENVKYENLLITNDENKPFHFTLIQKVEYLGKNKSEFQKFPFDKISTKADFIFQDSDLNISNLYKPEFYIIKGNKILYEWQITDHSINCCHPKSRGQQGTLEKINYSFELERKYFYYILKIIIPVVFLVWLSFSVFYIRAVELESKLAVSMGSLLTLVAYNFVFGDDVPKLNYITILDAWILLSYLFAGLSTMITIYSYWDYHRDKQTGVFNTLDQKLRWLMPISYHLLMIILYWGLMSDWSFTPNNISV
tara:strand:+ start:1470 stop:2861 length:1392 start_codon:yes stop_codon:yes gene_type:complete